MHGSGWVVFRAIHPQVIERLMEYVIRGDGRSTITDVSGGLYAWRRDPHEERGGVRRGNQVSDFHRTVAYAVSKLTLSRIDAEGEWAWSYRKALGEGLTRIVKSGWDPTPDDATDAITYVIKVELHATIHA